MFLLLLILWWEYGTINVITVTLPHKQRKPKTAIHRFKSGEIFHFPVKTFKHFFPVHNVEQKKKILAITLIYIVGIHLFFHTIVHGFSYNQPKLRDYSLDLVALAFRFIKSSSYWDHWVISWKRTKFTNCTKKWKDVDFSQKSPVREASQMIHVNNNEYIVKKMS